MEKETQIMFCDKDEFPTSALNLHLKLHVVYLILLKRTSQETVCSFLLLVTDSEYKNESPLVQKKNHHFFTVLVEINSRQVKERILPGTKLVVRILGMYYTSS